LAPGEQREVGFAYGIGGISAAGPQGRLALSVEGNFLPGRSFTVLAYVREPSPGERITLEVPPGLVRVQGGEHRPIPAPVKGTTRRNSVVSWRVRASRPGSFTLRVRTTAGAEETLPVQVGGQPTPKAP
jgi:hypothetical protein